MATPEQIELAESEVIRLIDVAKRQGLNSWDLEDIFLRATEVLHCQASVEYKVKGGQ